MGASETSNEGNELMSDRTVPYTYGNVILTGDVLGIVIGSVSGVLVLVAAIVIYVVYKKRQRRKSWNFDLHEIDPTSQPKSAPISRSASPKIPKRKSCPDMTVDIRTVMIRSATSTCIPDFILPPERIQPLGEHETGSVKVLSPEVCVGIRPDLYRCPSEADIDGTPLPPSEHGRIWFSVVYDGAVEQLNVTLVKVKELTGRGHGDLRDPFVRIYLLPDERNSKTSKVKKKTLAPMYNELFIFQLPTDDVDRRTLRFSVYDVDKRRMRHALGHALVPLRELDKAKNGTLWKDLEPNSHIHSYHGDINIGLCYLPHNDKIKVTILNGRHLRHLDYDRLNGIYVKVQMNHARRPYKSKKTVIKNTADDPIFNESFSFCIAGQPVDACNFVITTMVCPKKHLSQNEIYGKVVVGSFMFARGDELVHWQEMMSQPRTTITKWHTLSNDMPL